MSAPIRSTSNFSLNGLDGNANKFKTITDDTYYPEDNAAALEAGIGLLQSEIRLVETQLDDIRSGLTHWADLTRKMNTEERITEEALCEKFKSDLKLDDTVSKRMTYLKSLKAVLGPMARDWALVRARVPPTAVAPATTAS